MKSRIRHLAALAAVWVLSGTVGAAGASADAVSNGPGRVSISTLSDLSETWALPTWGGQIPKLVYDGHWYYATTLDANGTEYPPHERIWKSRNGRDWTQVWELPGHVYQPLGMVLDSKNDMFLEVGCFTGAPCYPGVAPRPGPDVIDVANVYAVRLLLDKRLPDGSIDFSKFHDYTVRTGTAQFYYMGMSIDPTRRYVYTAYTVDNWDVWFNVFDTKTGTESTHLVGSAPTGHAWLYFIIQPGKAPGEIYLSFEQAKFGGTSASIDAALLLRSTDGGASFPETYTLAATPNTDGNLNWVDSSDLTLDSHGEINMTFFRSVGGVSTLYYQRGVNGTPMPIGPLDNHSQIAVDPSGKITVFSSEHQRFAVATSTDGGLHWDVTTYPYGTMSVYVPNLLRSTSGSSIPPALRGLHPGYQMLLSGRRTAQSPFSLLFATYRDRNN